ncbi:MAG TPA: hypothetical protein VM056_00320 [Terriglobales bacterium]|nr:hypothetical protein [Terriglobales bacterium]
MSSSPMHLTGPQDEKPEREGLPFVPVLIALAVIGLIGITAYQVMGSHPVGAVTIEKMNAMEVPPNNRVLAEFELAIQNTTDKPLKYHSVELTLVTEKEKFKDSPASAPEVPRIYQAYPALRQSSADPLKPDTMVPAGSTLRGTVLLAFPVTKAGFDARKHVEATVFFYEESPIRTKK